MAVAAATVTIRNRTRWLLSSIITVLIRSKFSVANHWKKILSEDEWFSSSCSPFYHHATSEDRIPLWKQVGIHTAPAATPQPGFVTRTPVQQNQSMKYSLLFTNLSSITFIPDPTHPLNWEQCPDLSSYLKYLREVIETWKQLRKKSTKQHDLIFLTDSKYLRVTRDNIPTIQKWC